MNIFTHRIRRPVERDGAAVYVFLTLLSFGLSVMFTRLFLQVTGYPQLGSGTLHIAHLLWGGLFLFIGAISMLIFANRWVYRLGAILSGLGVGLFIDEVGKFITRTNDYFYPPAAPIIYAFFLLVVLLYLRLRRNQPRDTRSELYRVVDTLEEVLERDLDHNEQALMENRLNFVIDHAEYPDQQHFARELLRFIQSNQAPLVDYKPGFGEKITGKLLELDARWLTRRRFKAILIAGLGTMGLWAAMDLINSMQVFFSPGQIEEFLLNLIRLGRLTGSTSLVWLQMTISLQAGCGLVLLLGTILLILGKDARAVRISFFGLLMFLTMADLLKFYFDQFSTIGPAFVQFTLLLLLINYRRRFVHARL